LNLSDWVLGKLKSTQEFAASHNPFYAGAYSDVLALIPFLLLTVLLYLVGREVLLRGPTPRQEAPPQSGS
jgi:hypothetical protein